MGTSLEKILERGSHLKTLYTQKCHLKSFSLVLICQPQKWIFQSYFFNENNLIWCHVNNSKNRLGGGHTSRPYMHQNVTQNQFFPCFIWSFNLFLDASSHLYLRLCLSVGPSVSQSIGPSVHPQFIKTLENQGFCMKIIWKCIQT